MTKDWLEKISKEKEEEKLFKKICWPTFFLILSLILEIIWFINL